MENSEIRKPKNTREVFRWLVFEPELLQDFSWRRSTLKDRLEYLLQPYVWAVSICILMWLVVSFLIA